MTIVATVDRGVFTLTLNRPERKNAFTLEMVESWADALHAAQSDSGVGAVVVTGAGDAFCAGADVHLLASGMTSPVEMKRMLMKVHRVAMTLEQMDKPVLAAVNGPAVGAGMDMALMCDMRFASRSARFCASYIQLGLVPGNGGCLLLSRLVGPAIALELLLGGEFVDAERAEAIGLVNRVVDDDRLLVEAQEFAQSLAAASPEAIRIIKQSVRDAVQMDLRSHLDAMSSHMAVVSVTSEARAAVSELSERLNSTRPEEHL